MNPEMLPGLLREVFNDIQEPSVLWQLTTVLAALFVGWLVRHHYRRFLMKGNAARWESLRSVATRVALPLTAYLLVVVARFFLKPHMHVSLLNLVSALLIAAVAVRLTIYVLRQAFDQSNALAPWERLIATCVWAGVALHITGLLPDVIAGLESVSFALGKQRFNLWDILHSTFTIGMALILGMWAGNLVELRLAKAEKLDSSVRVVMSRFLQALILVVTVLAAISMVGVDLTTFSIFGGALGVGLGFSLQRIASNYLSGFVILMDRSIRLGNVIALDANTTGVVTQITTRYTVLRSLAGTEFIVPNELLMTTIVQNQTYTDSRVFLKNAIQVAYGTDVEAAMAALVEAAASVPRVLKDPAPFPYLTAFADSGINLEVGFWIADPEAGTGSVRSAVNLAILRRFNEMKVEIPFPQREVRVVGEDGHPPPSPAVARAAAQAGG